MPTRSNATDTTTIRYTNGTFNYRYSHAIRRDKLPAFHSVSKYFCAFAQHTDIDATNYINANPRELFATLFYARFACDPCPRQSNPHPYSHMSCRNNFMKSNLSIPKYILIILIIFLIFLGIRIASANYKYENLVDGISSLFLVYLFVRVFWTSATEAGINEALDFPNVVKLLAFVFVYSIVVFWSLLRLTATILLILKTMGL
jgi:hypothetical protein